MQIWMVLVEWGSEITQLCHHTFHRLLCDSAPYPTDPYMAAKLLLAPLSSFSSSNLRIYQNQHHGHPRLPSYRAQPRRKASVHASLDDPAFSASCYRTLFTLADTAGYSQASYYTSLGLFVISVPGLWSLIKRSVKSKVYMNSCFLHTYICSLSSKEKWVREVPICQ